MNWKIFAAVGFFCGFTLYYFVGVADKNNECSRLGGKLLVSPQGSFGYVCGKVLKP